MLPRQLVADAQTQPIEDEGKKNFVWTSTVEMLHEFYKPHNERLTQLLQKYELLFKRRSDPWQKSCYYPILRSAISACIYSTIYPLSLMRTIFHSLTITAPSGQGHIWPASLLASRIHYQVWIQYGRLPCIVIIPSSCSLDWALSYWLESVYFHKPSVDWPASLMKTFLDEVTSSFI